MKKLKKIRLCRLETRFLLNFVTVENNELYYPDNHKLLKTNINNVKDRREYKKRIKTLRNKLQLLDESFYIKLVEEEL